MDEDRKAFPLRISKPLFDQLKAWADQEMRSVNGQIEFLLREAVRRRRGDEAESADHSSAGKTPRDEAE